MNIFAGIGLFLAGMVVGEYYHFKIDRIRKEQIDELRKPRTVADIREENRRR